jgi:hypothetical protein
MQDPKLNAELAKTATSSQGRSLLRVERVAVVGVVIRLVLPALFLIGVLIACVPVMPTFPQPDLDSAWRYALNEAVARQMVFGRDIIFTLGPYACAYTGQYHPATDHLMLIGDTLLGLAFATGGLSLVSRGRIAYLLPLPVLIALVGRDAVLFSLPLLFLMVSVRVTLPDSHKWKLPENWHVLLSLALIMLALSLLPLVKGGHFLMSASLGGLGWLVLLRWRWRWALILGAVFVAGLIGFWLGAGQPLGALPTFFVAQMPILSGYSDAMSLTGSSSDLIWYGTNASLMLFASLLFVAPDTGLSGKAFCLGIALSLFFVFKAAFVRHDVHAMIAADFVLLVSFLFATSLPRFAAAVIIASSVATWLPTREHYLGTKGNNLIASIENSQSFGQLLEGLRARLGVGQDLRQQFEAARARIRLDSFLPRVDGGVDIYPLRQDILLASGLEWSPRPIVQSYSAYEPKLADINADHLLGNSAPRHVFFDVSPIDGRLATLEDGKSWPLLLARYRVVGRAGSLLLLDRNQEVGSSLKKQDLSVGRQRIGREFKFPKVSEPVWAEIDVRPTFLGRIFNFLFKLPQLNILFRFEDGHSEVFRYVAAMGRSGFIISPMIHDTYDFAALLTGAREQYFSSLRPTSVKIEGGVETRLFWKRAFDVRLQRIEVPVQAGAERFVYDQFVNDQWISDPTLNRRVAGSGECWIDFINEKPVTSQPVEVKGRLLVKGWAAWSVQRGIAADEVFVTLSSDDGNFLRAVRARNTPRSDVNVYFKHPEMGPVGFEAFLDTTAVKGRCKLQIYVKRQNEFFSCQPVIEIRN